MLRKSYNGSENNGVQDDHFATEERPQELRSPLPRLNLQENDIQ